MTTTFSYFGLFFLTFSAMDGVQAARFTRALSHWATSPDSPGGLGDYCDSGSYEMMKDILMHDVGSASMGCGSSPICGETGTGSSFYDDDFFDGNRTVEPDNYCDDFEGELSGHKIKYVQNDRTCFTDYYLKKYQKYEHDHLTSFKTNFYGIVTGRGEEHFRKCRTAYTEPRVAYRVLYNNFTETGDDEAEINMCLDVMSDWNNHTMTCTMRVNGDECNSCQVTPCRAFFKPEYVIDCSNLVRNATDVDTCKNTGTDDNIFRYWNVWEEDQKGFLDYCHREEGPDNGTSAAKESAVLVGTVASAIAGLLLGLLYS